MSPSKKLRIVYMGTPDFAVDALRKLAGSGDQVVGVVTQPDRRRGRGKRQEPTAVKAAASKLGLPVFQPENVNTTEALDEIRQWAPDVIVVAAYGQILKPDLLELPPLGCINIHASLLPKYRGAAPINWVIANGDEETGVTIMQMDPGLDTGPMLLKKKTLIGPLETAGELHDRLAEMGAELVVDVMRLIHLESLQAIDQDDSKATYARMLSKSDGAIDWEQPATTIADKIRGFNPWPGTYSFADVDGTRERIKFHLARALPAMQADPFQGEPAGLVIRADAAEGVLWIATGEGVLECLELQAPGRKALEVLDFLNGHLLSKGDRFEQP